MQAIAIDWSTIDRAEGSVWRDYWRLRREIFLDQKQWKLAAAPGAEFDCYDTPLCTWIMVKTEGRCVGGARIVPTTAQQFGPYSYMIRDFYRGILTGISPAILPAPPPVDPRVFEATRFFTDPSLGRTATMEVYKAIVDGVLAATSERGGDEVIALMPCAIYRIFRRLGYDVREHDERALHDNTPHSVGFLRVSPRIPARSAI